MDIKYEVVEVSDLPPEIAEEWGFGDDDYRAAVVLKRDGKIEKVLALDGGEPEDNSFRRDGRWIAPALNAAYALGKASV